MVGRVTPGSTRWHHRCERIRPRPVGLRRRDPRRPERWEQVELPPRQAAPPAAPSWPPSTRCATTLSSCRLLRDPTPWPRGSNPSPGSRPRPRCTWPADRASCPRPAAPGPAASPRGRRGACSPVVMSVVVLAVLIAPDPARLTDPVKTAREQFSMSTSAISVNEAVGAVLLASERGADLGESVTYQPRGPGTAAPSRSPPTGRRSLLRGAATESTIGVTGTQRVWVSDGQGLYRTADVRTTKVAGEGAQLEVLDARGDRFMSSLPAGARGTHRRGPEDWTFAGPSAPSRSAAAAPSGSTPAVDGSPVAAWWFDADTGVLLWNRALRPLTATVASPGQGSRSCARAPHAERRAMPSSSPSSRPPASQTDGLVRRAARMPAGGRWAAAGCLLVLRPRAGHRSMTLVYSDGFESAVVGWTEGVLDDGTTSRPTSAAGPRRSRVWQAGDAVIWVTTNGSPELLGEIGARLPQEAPYRASLVDRVVAGLRPADPGRLTPAAAGSLAPVFGIDAVDLVIILVLAVVMFGPEKLPQYSRKAAPRLRLPARHRQQRQEHHRHRARPRVRQPGVEGSQPEDVHREAAAERGRADRRGQARAQGGAGDAPGPTTPRPPPRMPLAQGVTGAAEPAAALTGPKPSPFDPEAT